MQSADLTPDPQKSHLPTFQIHGVLVRVADVGVVIVGESGTGKSQCALDLIRRGHQLVADDVVEIFEKDGKACGRPTEFTRGLMEIRGLGIVDAASMFGEEALCAESSIEIYVELSGSPAVDRFGAARHEHVLGEHRLPKFVFPAGASGGLASLIEKAVREYRGEEQQPVSRTQYSQQ